MGTLSCAVHYICTAWRGWDGITPNYRQTQYLHISAFNSIIVLTPYSQCIFLFVLLEGRGEEIEEPSRMGVLTCPLDVPITIQYTTLVQWFQKTCFFVILSFLDGLNRAAGSFFILFYGELIVWMLSNKNSRDVKRESTNISLLIHSSLKDFW